MVSFESLTEILFNSYNFSVQDGDLTIGPRQFVADTFVLRISSKSKYFIKVISSSSNIPNSIIQSLPITQDLYTQGLYEIPPIIKTIDGKLFVQSSQFIVVVFDYVEGLQTFAYDSKQIAEFLSKLHRTKSKLTIKQEIFHSYINEIFPSLINQTLTSCVDPVHKQFKSLIQKEFYQIQIYWKIFLQITRDCEKLMDDQFVITHGDIAGNVLLSRNNEIFVVDWDDILLAPIERDIWFFYKNEDFMNTYCSLSNSYKINQSYYRYYLLWRLFDDLCGWMNVIINQNELNKKEESFHSFKKDYWTWLKPLLAELE